MAPVPFLWLHTASSGQHPAPNTVSLSYQLTGSVKLNKHLSIIFLLPGTVLYVGDGELKNVSYTYVMYIGNVMYLCLYIVWHIGDS